MINYPNTQYFIFPVIDYRFRALDSVVEFRAVAVHWKVTFKMLPKAIQYPN